MEFKSMNWMKPLTAATRQALVAPQFQQFKYIILYTFPASMWRGPSSDPHNERRPSSSWRGCAPYEPPPSSWWCHHSAPPHYLQGTQHFHIGMCRLCRVWGIPGMSGDVTFKKKWWRLHQHMTEEMNRNTIISFSIYTHIAQYMHTDSVNRSEQWIPDVTLTEFTHIIVSKCFKRQKQQRRQGHDSKVVPRSFSRLPCIILYPPQLPPQKKIQNLINTYIE